MFFLACNHRKGGIIIAGSTSVQPFIEKVAEDFMEKHPEIKINVQGGGSTAGIQATFNKTCNIGCSSRNLKVSEKGLRVIVIAVDGIAVIVHKDNPIDNLDIEEIRGIFSGKIKNWKELGGKDKKVIPVTREEGSGTRGIFEEIVMDPFEKEIAGEALVKLYNGEVRAAVATDENAISYLSLGYLDTTVKGITIDGVEANIENILSEDFPIIRTLWLITKGTPSSLEQDFLDFILSDEGQEVVEEFGYIKVK